MLFHARFKVGTPFEFFYVCGTVKRDWRMILYHAACKAESLLLFFHSQLSDVFSNVNKAS